MSTPVQVILTDVEQAALALLAAQPLVKVRVYGHVKFRAAGMDIANETVIDQTISLPIPAVWAKANPEPINFNHDGIELQVTLSEPAAAAAGSKAAEPAPSTPGAPDADAAVAAPVDDVPAAPVSLGDVGGSPLADAGASE